MDWLKISSYLFSNASRTHSPDIQGVIAIKISNIAKRIFNSGIILSLEFTKPTEKIITGILNTITIIVPKEKFLLFSKFIEDEIEPRQDKINELIKKLKSNNVVFPKGKLIKILAKGIEIKNGIWIKIKCEKIFKIAINS